MTSLMRRSFVVLSLESAQYPLDDTRRDHSGGALRLSVCPNSASRERIRGGVLAHYWHTWCLNTALSGTTGHAQVLELLRVGWWRVVACLDF